MAYIIGPVVGHATLTGTSGNDFILAIGSHNTITSGGGSDLIYASAGNFNDVVLNGPNLTGADADTVNLFGIGDTLTGADQITRVHAAVNGSAITLGNGNDLVSVQGVGNSITLGHGTDSVMASGGHNAIVFETQDTKTYDEHVRLDGLANTVGIYLNHVQYPSTGTFLINGGSGQGTFNLGWGDGVLATGGVDNMITAGLGVDTIIAGSGADTVNIQGQYNNGGDDTIRLSGLNNVVTGQVRAGAITGGSGHTTVALQAGDFGSTLTVAVAGLSNSISLTQETFNPLRQAPVADVFAGSGQDTVTLSDFQSSVHFAGFADMLFIGDGTPNGQTPAPSVSVTDFAKGLDIILRAGQGNLSIDHFDQTGVIDLQGRGGFTSVSQIMAALQQTGAGAYTLVLADQSGTLTFTGTPHLDAGNFKIG